METVPVDNFKNGRFSQKIMKTIISQKKKNPIVLEAHRCVWALLNHSFYSACSISCSHQARAKHWRRQRETLVTLKTIRTLRETMPE